MHVLQGKGFHYVSLHGKRRSCTLARWVAKRCLDLRGSGVLRHGDSLDNSELGDARFGEINKNADASFGLPQLV